ncbi:hypothetical protein [Paenibacillus sinopodophylli]|uniref:hypothetical protein n=1 Tax=Paenibacillus sinopodophylli TaxID=1837342 RepID=UPI00110CA680|nr:hypothetical protein [Paenibacillus sinopodophylli]
MEGEQAVTATSFVIFPDGGWSNLPAPFQKLFDELSLKHAVYFVAAEPISSHAPAAIQALSLDQIEAFGWAEAAAVVLHPCWIQAAMAIAPKYLIAMPDSPQQGEPALWSKCRKWLCAHSDLIIADAEPYYLEQAFCTEHIFLLDGRDEVTDLLARQAFSWTLSGFSPKPLVRLQQRCLAEWHNKRLTSDSEKLGKDKLPTLFFHSVYQYLIYDLERAKESALAAFELAVLEGKSDALSMYYRFVSAIELKQGLTRAAVQTYSYTAVTDEDRRTVDFLDEWLKEGKDGLAGALLYRLNDDYKQSLARLELLESDPMAQQLTIECYIQTGKLKKAKDSIKTDQLKQGDEQQQYLLLRGTSALLAGQRHEAIHSFLEAAEHRIEALGNIAEIAALDAAVLELFMGPAGDSSPD